MIVAFLHERDKHAAVIAKRATRKDVLSKRQLAGDLVFEEGGQICEDQFWLFNWEKRDPNCYARRAIKNGTNLNDWSVLS